MGSLLSIIEGLNTGVLIWGQVGPLFRQLIANGKIDPNIVVTQDDLQAASVSLGMDISELDAAIARKKARDAQ